MDLNMPVTSCQRAVLLQHSLLASMKQGGMGYGLHVTDPHNMDRRDCQLTPHL
jgi:hypothetical protein